MIDVPGDLVRDLPCVQQASYLEGGPLIWMLTFFYITKENKTHSVFSIIYFITFHCLHDIILTCFIVVKTT